jgi:predicted TIM-barrel fold metal-dependent hydrolase
MIGLFKIFDAHVHFYSNSYFKLLIRQKLRRADINTELKNIASKGHIEIPGEDPIQLAKRWIETIDKWKIERLVLISSIPGDEDALVKAIKAYPDRLSGFFTVDPNSNLLMQNAEKRLLEDKLKGIVLYPSLYHLSINDEWLHPLLSLAQETRAIVVAQFGKLLIRPREFAGLRTIIDEEFTNPIELIPVAMKFPGIRFIIPNFGAGKFEEVLQVGEHCSSVYLDTAGSNSWMSANSPELTLKDVIAKVAKVYGPDRILFGSDSGLMPRGYRYDILDNQLKLVQDMRVPITHIKKMFYENLATLVGG